MRPLGWRASGSRGEHFGRSGPQGLPDRSMRTRLHTPARQGTMRGRFTVEKRPIPREATLPDASATSDGEAIVRYAPRTLFVLIAASLAAAPAVSAASGWYNMPTSLEQCLGVGFGPGYHAPLLLGPKLKSKIASQRIVRVPTPLTPTPACGFGAASCLIRPASSGPMGPRPGCDGGGYGAGGAAWSPAGSVSPQASPGTPGGFLPNAAW